MTSNGPKPTARTSADNGADIENDAALAAEGVAPADADAAAGAPPVQRHDPRYGLTPPAIVPPEQLRYARMLDLGARIGLVVLVLSFAAYVLGLAESHVPPDRLPQLWVHPVEVYSQMTDSPRGWGWVSMLHRGDFLGLTGIAILAGCSIFCLLALVPLYWNRRDRIYASLCVIEVLVLLLAASGLLAGGH